MKRTFTLILSYLLLATGAWAKDTDTPAKMLVAIPGMDAVTGEEAVASVQSMVGEVSVS